MPHQAAVAEGQPGLDDLEAAAARIGPRIPEGGDPAQPVRRGVDRQGQQRQRRRDRPRQVAHGAAGQVEQPERERDQRQAVAEVGLHQHERGEAAGHQQRWQEPAPDVGDLLLAARHERGEVEDQRHLGELGRLERHRSQPDPAPGTVDRLTDRRDQDEYQEHARQHQRRQHEALESPVVDTHRDEHPDRAQQRPEELLLEEEVRVAEAVGRHDGAGRVDHHDAGRQQHDRDPEQPHVGRDLAGHAIRPGGAPAPLRPRIPPARRAGGRAA